MWVVLVGWLSEDSPNEYTKAYGPFPEYANARDWLDGQNITDHETYSWSDIVSVTTPIALTRSN